MADLFPLIFAVLLGTLIFAHAMKHGAVRLLASAFAASAALVALFGTIRWLPGMVESVLRIELSWGWTAALAFGAAFFCYVVVLVVAIWILKLVFARDSWFHWMGHGFVGGLLSLFPAAVAIFFLFWCARVGGTVIELNHVARVSRPDIERFAGGIRQMPFPARWRNTVEAVPFVAWAFDGLDPFSNRVHRNAAALAVMQGSPVLAAFASEDPESADLLELPSVREAIRDPAVVARIHSGDRVGLVLSPQFAALGQDPAIAADLRRMRVDPLLRRFAAHLEAAALGDDPGFDP